MTQDQSEKPYQHRGRSLSRDGTQRLSVCIVRYNPQAQRRPHLRRALHLPNQSIRPSIARRLGLLEYLPKRTPSSRPAASAARNRPGASKSCSVKLGPTWALTRLTSGRLFIFAQFDAYLPPFKLLNFKFKLTLQRRITAHRDPGSWIQGITKRRNRRPNPKPASSLIVASPDSLNRAPVSKERTPSAVRGVTPDALTACPIQSDHSRIPLKRRDVSSQP